MPQANNLPGLSLIPDSALPALLDAIAVYSPASNILRSLTISVYDSSSSNRNVYLCPLVFSGL